ncbi:uncharacterized protein N7496_003329, partial [Penicillium cataractarum]
MVSLPAPQSESPTTVISARQFTGQPQFERCIVENICQDRHFQELMITDVPRGWEAFLWEIEESLQEPGNHTTPWRLPYGSWFGPRLLMMLVVKSSATIEIENGPYRTYEKEPAAVFRLYPQILPTLVVDICWSESYPALHNDMNRLLVGSNSDIRIVIIIKWNRQPNNVTVSGSLELYRTDSQGFPRLDQTVMIFPVPSSTEH